MIKTYLIMGTIKLYTQLELFTESKTCLKNFWKRIPWG